MYKRDDGRTVIIEEDMKWVLPKGVSADSPGIKKAINEFGERVTSARADGEIINYDKWKKLADQAIDAAVEKELKKKK